MSFLKTTFNLLTDNRDIKEPIIIKEFNDKSELLGNLEKLRNSNSALIDQKKVANHLKLFSIGQSGEKSVLFELQNSMLPIAILHDVNIEIDGYKAQIDFVIVTHRFILILEVKKLFGDIKVTDKGEFQRVIRKYNKVVNKEGMYSPINQVERHVAILEKLLRNKGVINKCPIRYAVTFANPKTIIEISKNAPKHIQSSVLRHDQIKDFLSKELKQESPVFMLDKMVMEIANAIKEESMDVAFEKDRYIVEQLDTEEVAVTIEVQVEETASIENTDELREKLVSFRLRQSRELKVKPYYIYTNKTLDSILEHRPKTIPDLLKVEGIGPKKAEEFGKEILSILND